MRRIWPLRGGVHPPENKVQSLQRPIASAPLPPELVLPLSQHSGAPAEAVVSVGARVLKGQLVAAAKGTVSAAVHASSSGVVCAIEDRRIAHPSGLSAPCIVIRTDGEDRWIDHQSLPESRWTDSQLILDRIAAAGIVGLGGAGFPSAVKLTPRVAVKTLIVNGTECEPYITADDALMRERAEGILLGVRILASLLGVHEVLIGIEDNKPEAIVRMRSAAGSTVEVVEFPTCYPSGGEKQLIQILTGREVPSGGLPADLGIVCVNVGTAYAAGRAVAYGEPLISRITTLTGNALARPGNVEVLIGTPIRLLLDHAGCDSSRAQSLIMGGPMMGFSLDTPDAPVIKTTNCVLVPTAAEFAPAGPAQACIRCGLCAQVCPASLLPQQLYWYAQAKDFPRLESHELFDCIECGACAWVCPSNIPLVQYYRASKAAIRKQNEDQLRSEQSRARFEARQARLDSEAAEKEARRRERAARAAARSSAGNAEDRAALVDQAVARVKARKAIRDPADTNGVAIDLAAAKTIARLQNEGDPAAAAITRAQARRSIGGDKSGSGDALHQAATASRRKLNRAREKLAAAEQAGDSETARLLLDTIPKLEERLRAAESALARVRDRQ